MTDADKPGSYEDGVAAAQRGDLESAVRLWRHVAEQGHVKAQYNLGVAYARGMGVPQDMTEATKWWRWAAELGHEAAKDKLKELGAVDDEEEPRDSSINDEFQYAHWVEMVKSGPLADDDWRLKRLEEYHTRLGARGVELFWRGRLKEVEKAASDKASGNLLGGIMIGFLVCALVLLFAK